MKRNIVLFLALLSCFCLGAFAFSATKYDPVNGYPPPIGEPLFDQEKSVVSAATAELDKVQEDMEYDVLTIDSKNAGQALESEFEEAVEPVVPKTEQRIELFAQPVGQKAESKVGIKAGSKEPEKKDKYADSSALPQQIEGLNLVGYSDAGKKSWDIKGETADIIGNKVNVTKVDANSYGDQDTNLKAQKGQINRTTGNVHLENDVVITTKNGAQMKTDVLDWNRGDNIVTTKSVVTLEDDTMKIKGQGMEAHPALKAAKLESNVTADIQAESKDQKKGNRIQITSDGSMEIDQMTQRAVFTDNVVAEELSTGRLLKADRMEVLFDLKSKKVKEIVCTGNVEVHQDKNVTHSDMLVYKADEQRTLLKGRPKLIIDAEGNDTSAVFKF